MATLHVQPIIMAGGSGTRLWPLSRASYPKQFLVLAGRTSLFQDTVSRLRRLTTREVSAAPSVIVGNEEHRFLLLDQFREMGTEPGAVILEPVGRNTAPALTLAALHAIESGTDPVLVVTPADQTVTDVDAYCAALGDAVRSAAAGSVVLLGVRPVRPETGFGYMRCDPAAGRPMNVVQFVEKPDLATAENYLAAGCYFWNSGMFVLRASTWMAALERFRPDAAEVVRRAWHGRSNDAPFIRPEAQSFAQVPAESVDYAVMENCPGSEVDIRMLPLDAGWNDLGAWDSVWQVAAKDERGNAVSGDTLLNDCDNLLVHASERLVSIVGMRDAVVIETADAVLVANRERSQEVKRVVDQLQAQRRPEQALHRKVYRPWGWYDCIDSGPRFQVKRIMVKPGASLSLQKHHHRAEHWIVVSGTAEVTAGENVKLLTENQSTYIPLGEVHRLANPGKVPLEIIEVQSGSYLGEDDIVRFEDTYGRTN